MKKSHINRMYLIFIFTMLAVSIGVFLIVYTAAGRGELHGSTALYSMGMSGALIILTITATCLLFKKTAVPYVKKLAYTDALTGYENRMAFEHRLREVGDIAERGIPVAMIIFDVNDLKTINDVKGHNAGDTYIVNTVDVIYEKLHDYGPLYRIGGDEFASLIIGKDEIELERVMDDLRTENRPVYEDYPFSCACGVAFFIKGIDRTMRDVLKRADDAMYEEKKRQKSLIKAQEPEDIKLDIAIARQPIYDKKLKVFAYELLYRNSSHKNACDEKDGDFATASVLAGAFLSCGIESLTDKKKGFINFTDALLSIESIKTLPSRYLGIEILESTKPTPEALKACSELYDLGYTIVLDDYTLGGPCDEFVKYAKIIKVDFLTSTDEHAWSVVKQYQHKGIQFVAEKIETKEAYEKARAYGYDYFQGYYFSRPAIIKSTLISPLHINVLRVLSLLRDEDCDINEVAGVIKYDPGIAHNLYRLANSVAYGAGQKVSTLKDAIMRIGLSELRVWLFFILTYSMYSEKPHELVKQSILRARAAEEICNYKNLGDNPGFSLIGLFSLLDTIMDAPLETILSSIPMPEKLKEALINPGKDIYGAVINMIRAYDKADWNEAEQSGGQIDLSLNEYGKIYMDSLVWCDNKCAAFSSM